MAGERRVTTFQHLLDEGSLEIGDGYRAQNHELGGAGPIFLRAGHVTDTHIDFTGVDHFHEHLAAKVRSKMSKEGDTIITTKGNSTGRTSFVTDRLPSFVYSPHLSYWRSRDPDELCSGFLRYWSQGVEFVDQLSSMKGSTDMAPYLSLTDQRRLSITLPPAPEQRAIAHVLGTLDDLIELNRETNEILEEMARALFKSWFVDFDPVRAKLEGRQPAGMDAETAALFPDHFQDSELGEIPKGWNVRPLSQNIELLSGGTPKTSEPSYWGGGIPWYSVKDAPSDADVWVVDTEKKVTSLGISNSAAKILPEKTTIISARGTVGKLALTGCPMAMNQSCYGVRGASGYGEFFTYYALKEAVEELQQNAHGSVFDTITRETFASLRVASPPPSIAKSFDGIVEPLLEAILANVSESRDLATLRDTLLPKLLSGDVSAPDSVLERCRSGSLASKHHPVCAP